MPTGCMGEKARVGSERGQSSRMVTASTGRGESKLLFFCVAKPRLLCRLATSRKGKSLFQNSSM